MLGGGGAPIIKEGPTLLPQVGIICSLGASGSGSLHPNLPKPQILNPKPNTQNPKLNPSTTLFEVLAGLQRFRRSPLRSLRIYEPKARSEVWISVLRSREWE